MTDFVILLAAATVGGLFAVLLKFPVFVGFIAGGMLVGPSGVSAIQKLRYVETLSQIGGEFALQLDSKYTSELKLRLSRSIGVVCTRNVSQEYPSGAYHKEIFVGIVRADICELHYNGACVVETGIGSYWHRSTFARVVCVYVIIGCIVENS